MNLRSLAAALLALTLSLVLNACLFGFLPALDYWCNSGEGPEERARETRLVPLPMMPKKKEKPKPQENKAQPTKPSVEPGKALARQRFVMDLGAAGGTGAAIAGGAVDRASLEQVAFAEGETDEDAQAIARPAPRMPKEAEKAGVGGLVRCMLTIGEDGRVAHAEFLEVPGHFGFVAAVREALSQWKFKPAMNGGIPVRQRIEQPFQF